MLRRIGKKKLKSERSIIISGSAIKELLKQKKMKQIELAQLLGVNAATMSRWGSESDDMPTSTTFLVLIPLLLSVGIDLMPEYYNKAVAREFATVFGVNELNKNSTKLEELAHERFWSTNVDLLRARRLFDALNEAWQVLEARHKAPNQNPPASS
jgi:transcriptional regulator with XRE-family HTH domain